MMLTYLVLMACGVVARADKTTVKTSLPIANADGTSDQADIRMAALRQLDENGDTLNDTTTIGEQTTTEVPDQSANGTSTTSEEPPSSVTTESPGVTLVGSFQMNVEDATTFVAKKSNWVIVETGIASMLNVSTSAVTVSNVSVASEQGRRLGGSRRLAEGVVVDYSVSAATFVASDVAAMKMKIEGEDAKESLTAAINEASSNAFTVTVTSIAPPEVSDMDAATTTAGNPENVIGGARSTVSLGPTLVFGVMTATVVLM